MLTVYDLRVIVEQLEVVKDNIESIIYEDTDQTEDNERLIDESIDQIDNIINKLELSE